VGGGDPWWVERPEPRSDRAYTIIACLLTAAALVALVYVRRVSISPADDPSLPACPVPGEDLDAIGVAVFSVVAGIGTLLMTIKLAATRRRARLVLLWIATTLLLVVVSVVAVGLARNLARIHRCGE
jgi:hypothetical protein